MDNATKQRLQAKIAEIEAGLHPYVVRLPDDDPLRRAVQEAAKELRAEGKPLMSGNSAKLSLEECRKLVRKRIEELQEITQERTRKQAVTKAE